MNSGTKPWITRLLLISVIGCSANEQQRGEAGASAGVSPASIMPKVDTAPTGSHKAQAILAVLRSFIDLSGADYDLSVCQEAGVSTIIYYPIPIHRQPAYADLEYGSGSLPITESLCSEVLSLPIFPELSTEQQDSVIAAVRSLVGAEAVVA